MIGLVSQFLLVLMDLLSLSGQIIMMVMGLILVMSECTSGMGQHGFREGLT